MAAYSLYEMMTRKEQLQSVLSAGDDLKIAQLIDEVIFIEEQLVELRKLPFIVVHPDNPNKQKTTPAAKQYKELLQQYNMSLRLLFRITGETGENGDESPLRKWLKERSI